MSWAWNCLQERPRGTTKYTNTHSNYWTSGKGFTVFSNIPEIVDTRIFLHGETIFFPTICCPFLLTWRGHVRTGLGLVSREKWRAKLGQAVWWWGLWMLRHIRNRRSLLCQAAHECTVLFTPGYNSHWPSPSKGCIFLAPMNHIWVVDARKPAKQLHNLIRMRSAFIS